MRKCATTYTEITVYPSIVTPLGHYFWDPSRVNAAFLAGAAAALTGLFLGTSLSLGFDSGLGTAVLGLISSAFMGLAGVVCSLRA